MTNYDEFLKAVGGELSYREKSKVKNRSEFKDEWEMSFVTGECPTCGALMISDWYFCPKCGQCIDWDGKEEN